MVGQKMVYIKQLEPYLNGDEGEVMDSWNVI